MKKVIFFFLLITIVLSCNSKKTEEEISSLEKQLVALKKKYNSKSDFDYNFCLNKNRSLELGIKNNLSRREKRLSFLLKEDSWLAINGEKFLDFLLKEIDIKNYDLERALSNSHIMYPFGEGEDGFAVHYESNFASYMIYRIDRSPESLESFFTPEVKETAYALLRHNNLYKDSGSYAMVKAMILAYNAFEYDKEPLSRIYKIASESYMHDDSIDAIISDIAPAAVIDALKDENYSNYSNASEYSTIKRRLTNIYAFWARRHYEGNLDFTYTLLKELHRNVAYEEL